MQFGQVQPEELETLDFCLAQEPLFNQQILPGTKNNEAKIYIGCAKWGRQEWIGKVYPEKTKEKDFLQYYVQHYNSIELNATHYKIYGPRAIEKWNEKAEGRDFLFCPKMYKGITHFGRLTGKDFLTTEFFRGILAFGKHLGPVFIQVSEVFSPKRKEELFTFLKSLPTDMQFFLEVRHADWFKKDNAEELFQTLHALNIGAVITDTAGKRDCAHMYLTVPKTFIRYVGNSLHHTDYTRIDAWVERMKYWLSKGINDIYFFMHMHNEATSPELTVYLVDKMNKECGLNLMKPKFINAEKQGNLFS